MHAGVRAVVAAGMLSFLTAAAALAQTPAPPGQGEPVFHGTTTLVPVDVIVVDRNGKPVTDLTQNDFAVFEDGVRQPIRHFATQILTPTPPTPGAFPTPLAPTVGPGPRDELPLQNYRVFLIVLGRGRLQGPASGVDGILHFVRTDLLPQDRVAVLAWNRGTEFTTDHAKIADLIERFKRMHEGIESKLKSHFSGLAAVYGGSQIPPAIQADIDTVFGGPAARGTRTTQPGTSPNADRLSDDTRQTTDLLLAPSASAAPASNVVQPTSGTFDDFVSTNAQTMQDLGTLYLGVEYLRFLSGEKHLVFVTETGLVLPRADDERDLAAAAADARVTIDYVYTGGLVTNFDVAGGRRGQRGRRGGPMPRVVDTFPTARTLATLTGGQFYGNRFAHAADDLNRMDEATRAEFVLGYYPMKSALDGRYRRITVRVDRPGLTVLYRHGYFARETPPFDQRGLITYSRMVSAVNYAKPVADIALRVKPIAPPGAGGTTIAIDVTVDLSRVVFAKANGRNTASIEIGAFCVDGRDAPVGQVWQTIELNLANDRLQQFLRDGLSHTMTVELARPAKRAKVVVYDYDADLLGSVNVTVP